MRFFRRQRRTRAAPFTAELLAALELGRQALRVGCVRRQDVARQLLFTALGLKHVPTQRSWSKDSEASPSRGTMPSLDAPRLRSSDADLTKNVLR